MSTVIHFPNLRLAQVLRQPGGKRVGAALRDGQAGLDSLATNCLAEIDRLLAQLDLARTEMETAPTASGLRRIYDLSGELIGIGSVAGLPALGQAAHSFCELLDGMALNGAISIEPIAMHMHSLHVLRRKDISLDTVAQELANLERVRGVLASSAAGPTGKGCGHQGQG